MPCEPASQLAEQIHRLEHRCGGRDVILTDNPVSDRKQFIDAYREVIARERMKMGMTPTVARFVEDNRPLLDDRRAAFETGEKKLLERWATK